MARTINRGSRNGVMGRPPSEPTKVVRLPVDLADVARRIAENRSGAGGGIGAFMKGEVRLSASAPLVTASVACGFPSPAEDHLDRALDMNELHGIGRPEVILVRVVGESMTGRGIYPDDIVTVNKALEPRNGCIVVACLNGDFTLKTYFKRKGKIILQPENPAFPVIEVPDAAEFFIWGVVTNCTKVF